MTVKKYRTLTAIAAVCIWLSLVGNAVVVSYLLRWWLWPLPVAVGVAAGAMIGVVWQLNVWEFEDQHN